MSYWNRWATAFSFFQKNEWRIYNRRTFLWEFLSWNVRSWNIHNAIRYKTEHIDDDKRYQIKIYWQKYRLHTFYITKVEQCWGVNFTSFEEREIRMSMKYLSMFCFHLRSSPIFPLIPAAHLSGLRFCVKSKVIGIYSVGGKV